MALAFRSAPVHGLAYLVSTVAVAAIPIAAAWLTKFVLDRLTSTAGLTNAPSPTSELVGLALALAAAGVALGVVPQVAQYLRAEMDRRAALRAHDELFAAVEQVTGVARFEDPRFQDRLRLAQQSASSPAQTADAVFEVVRGTLTLGGFVGSLAVISPGFTAVVLAAAVPAVLLELRLSRRRAAMLWRIGPIERRQMLYGDLLASAEAAKEIRLFGLGSYLRGRMIAERRAADADRRRTDRREVAVQGALAALSAAVAGGGLVWVVVAAARGRVTVGDVSMFVAAVAGLQGALGGLVTSMAAAHHQVLLFGHYIAVVDAGPDLPAPDDPAPLPALRRGIEVRDVWFRYSDDHPWALRGVNLFLPHGAAVALVGRNGAGKSTLAKLLCRFYDPTRGAILWDGVDLRDVPVEELRRRIGAVLQDFMTYDFSAADNIAMGDLAALGDMERIRGAAVRAGIDGTLSRLPRGYDTLLTRLFFGDSENDDPQNGVMLSGGQWQRVALARAFLREKRELMILDEPNAGLDPDAEHEVHDRLRAIRAGRGSLLISHRLSAVRDADLIVVLSDGVITERGRHADLLAAQGAYARMFTVQAAGYTEEPGGQGRPDAMSEGTRR
ncbi:ATP-binding cassette domain-containing protein [Nonomuraea phyllanthi]|uniref:ATP-binding cassette domain-containing protein n=2 Tax=Nonomuraea phyllanthi TaxID=2219224 RepID=A0A5C4WJ54_9ACTN|nr:ATP-binding cassette domain-containing protein [Nonomuraea phyllanthi]